MDKDMDLQVAALEEAMAVMARALQKLQCLSPGMDADALSHALEISIDVEKAADDLKGATKLLRETTLVRLMHPSMKG